MYKTFQIKESLPISFQNEVEEYLTPEVVTIKLPPNHESLTKNNIVYKDTILFLSNYNYYSPISGKIIVKNSNELQISYDFMENYYQPQNSSRQKKYSIEEIRELLIKYGFSNFQILDQLNRKKIIINGINCRPYQINQQKYLLNYSTQILETCDILYESLNPQQLIFALSSKNTSIIELYNNNIGNYPYIEYRYFNDEYPLCYPEIIVSKLTISPEEILYLTIEDVIEMYQIIKRKRPLSEKYITIASPEIDKSFVLNVKIGTSLKDIIVKYQLPTTNMLYLENNILNNDVINPQEYIIDHTTQAIYILKENIEKPGRCIGCGKCNEVCPFGINPLNKAELVNCRRCGLCRYFCPQRLDLGRSKDNA